MYSGMKKIEEVLRYIEENITSDIECDTLAQKMSLSVYEFRRIFAFIIGCPLSEYIRKRRLSLAACEIMKSDKVDLLSLSEKYKYSSQAAFSKAFKEYHGYAPTMCLKGQCNIKLFTVPSLEFSISNRDTIPFKMISEPDFYICGYSGISTITDSCCCENVWNEFYEKEFDKKLVTDKIFAAYDNQKDNVICTLGEYKESPPVSLPYVHIKKGRWACFKLNTTDDEFVNEIYSKIIYEWLPSANLCINKEMPTIEVYPFDMAEDGFEWEIRIPIE